MDTKFDRSYRACEIVRLPLGEYPGKVVRVVHSIKLRIGKEHRGFGSWSRRPICNFDIDDCLDSGVAVTVKELPELGRYAFVAPAIDKMTRDDRYYGQDHQDEQASDNGNGIGSRQSHGLGCTVLDGFLVL
mgnify:CR=1 FL=1